VKLNKRTNGGKNLTYTINPIVLHRVVSEIPEHFEDITKNTFQSILTIPGVTFTSIDSAMSHEYDTNVICLTFDDGFSSDWEIVFPRLLEKGLQATFFIVVDWIGKPGFMSASQIRELSKNGMQIGSHSLSHPNFLSIDRVAQEKELRLSRLKLEDLLGSAITSFAFPYGSADQNIIDSAFDSGYTYCCTSSHGLFCKSTTVLPRNSINSSMAINEVRRVLEADWATRLKWKIEDIGKPMLKKYMPNLYRRFKSQIMNKE